MPEKAAPLFASSGSTYHWKMKKRKNDTRPLQEEDDPLCCLGLCAVTRLCLSSWSWSGYDVNRGTLWTNRSKGHLGGSCFKQILSESGKGSPCHCHQDVFHSHQSHDEVCGQRCKLTTVSVLCTGGHTDHNMRWDEMRRASSHVSLHRNMQLTRTLCSSPGQLWPGGRREGLVRLAI